MMLLSKPLRSILFSAFLLTANADTIRGVQQRKLKGTQTVTLGTAGNYAILTKSGISTVPDSVITGDIAVSPIAATAMTGFSLTSTDVGKASTSAQVSGKAYGASYIAPTPAHLTTAVSDMEIAYTDAAGRTNSNAAKINLGGGEIGGETLTSEPLITNGGVYTFQSLRKINLGGGEIGGETLTSQPLGVYTFQTDVTINDDVFFEGDSDDVFIIQMTGNLVVAGGKKVKLVGGAKAENIIWQVAGYVVVEAGAHMEGILLVKTSVLFKTGSSLNGRILAQTATNLQMATITKPSVSQV
eukprot:CAMPEP_0172327710 /NCGR_PEP_ID=MMETSP1058-20130122/59974_1 /TAXON_ID=83371 /ORGANISM="Detonula confervacea, Strain CCMP 353" /LENGTH=298 /DNA_ID=CAMNT_0013044793 /DNA_START=18 /DNA_END=913 /DNA_ORIENTATION=+